MKSKVLLSLALVTLCASWMSAQSLSGATLTYYTTNNNTFVPTTKSAMIAADPADIVAYGSWLDRPTLTINNANPVTLKWYVKVAGSGVNNFAGLTLTNACVMDKSGTVSTYEFPMLPPCTVYYWFEDGGNRVPLNTNYTFAVSSRLGWQRSIFRNGTTLMGITTVLGAPRDNVYLPSDSLLPDSDKWYFSDCWYNSMGVASTQINIQSNKIFLGKSYIRTPLLKGIGRLEFKAQLNESVNLPQDIIVEQYIPKNSPSSEVWNQVGAITTVESTVAKVFVYPTNTHEECYLRIRRLPVGQTAANLTITDIEVTLPSADIRISVPRVSSPGYPSIKEPVTFFLDVETLDPTYLALNLNPVFNWAMSVNNPLFEFNQPWIRSPMTLQETLGSTNRYSVTITQSAGGTFGYYNEVKFDGVGITNATMNSYYIGEYGQIQTNVQDYSIRKTAEFRRFLSSHDSIALWDVDTNTLSATLIPTARAKLVADNVWQVILPMTSPSLAYNISPQATLPYLETSARVAVYGSDPDIYGDIVQSDELRTPPMNGNVVTDTATNGLLRMEIDDAKAQFLAFRLDLPTKKYQLRRAAFQDFDMWQASEDYFDFSIGNANIDVFTSMCKNVDTSTLYPTWHPITFGSDSKIPAFDPLTSFSTGIRTLGGSWYQSWSAWVINEQRPSEDESPMNPNSALRINGAADGYVRSFNTNTNGVDTFSFRHHLSFGGDGRPTYHTGGFAWSNYTVTATINASAISPASPSVSLFGYMGVDPDAASYYEFRVSYRPNYSTLGTQPHGAVLQLFKMANGTMTYLHGYTNTSLVVTSPFTMSLTITNTATGIGVRLATTNASVTAANYSWGGADSASPRLQGGTMGANIADFQGTVTNLYVMPIPASNFDRDNTPAHWVTRGNQLGTSTPRWAARQAGTGTTNIVLTRAVPTLSYDVNVARMGTSGTYPASVTWWSNVVKNATTSLDYATRNVVLHCWDRSFVEIVPAASDAMLVVDDLYLSDWGGLTIYDDPNSPFPYDPYAVWKGEQANVKLFAEEKTWELTRSRANPNKPQYVRSPHIAQGIGDVGFSYRTDGEVVFAIQVPVDPGYYMDNVTNWKTVDIVTNNTYGQFIPYYCPITDTEMDGVVRVTMLEVDAPGDSSMFISNIRATSYPRLNETSWRAFNARVTPTLLAYTFEGKSAHLNNGVSGVPPSTGAQWTNDNPFVESAEINTGIGQVEFWYRKWTGALPGKLTVKVAPERDTPLDEWVTINNSDTVQLQNIQNEDYVYFKTEMADISNHYVRIYASTNNISRVAIDNVIITEPLVPAVDILKAGITPEIPLGTDAVGAYVELGNRRLARYQDLEVLLDYYVGTNIWGRNAWPTVNTIKLTLGGFTNNNRGAYYVVAPGTGIPPQPIDTAVQYSIRVHCPTNADIVYSNMVYYTGFETPPWYAPIDLNSTNVFGASRVKTPHYFVFSCGTNEVSFNAYFNGFYGSDAPNEFIGLIGPKNVNISGWKLTVVNAATSTYTYEDDIATTIIPPNTYLTNGTVNGWAFFVFGDSGVAERQLPFAKGGTLLPTWGGFRLERGMGAYVDRITYGDSYGPTDPLVQRGYTFTLDRNTGWFPWPVVFQYSSRVAALAWETVEPKNAVIGGMNAGQSEVLGNCKNIYPDPSGESGTAAGVRTFIQSITVGNPAVSLSVVVESTNGVPMTGWKYRVSKKDNPSAPSAIWQQITLNNIPNGMASTNTVTYTPDPGVGTMFFKSEAIGP